METARSTRTSCSTRTPAGTSFSSKIACTRHSWLFMAAGQGGGCIAGETSTRRWGQPGEDGRPKSRRPAASSKTRRAPDGLRHQCAPLLYPCTLLHKAQDGKPLAHGSARTRAERGLAAGANAALSATPSRYLRDGDRRLRTLSTVGRAIRRKGGRPGRWMLPPDGAAVDRPRGAADWRRRHGIRRAAAGDLASKVGGVPTPAAGCCERRRITRQNCPRLRRLNRAKVTQDNTIAPKATSNTWQGEIGPCGLGRERKPGQNDRESFPRPPSGQHQQARRRWPFWTLKRRKRRGPSCGRSARAL